MNHHADSIAGRRKNGPTPTRRESQARRLAAVKVPGGPRPRPKRQRPEGSRNWRLVGRKNAAGEQVAALVPKDRSRYNADGSRRG